MRPTAVVGPNAPRNIVRRRPARHHLAVSGAFLRRAFEDRDQREAGFGHRCVTQFSNIRLLKAATDADLITIDWSKPPTQASIARRTARHVCPRRRGRWPARPPARSNASAGEPCRRSARPPAHVAEPAARASRFPRTPGRIMVLRDTPIARLRARGWHADGSITCQHDALWYTSHTS